MPFFLSLHNDSLQLASLTFCFINHFLCSSRFLYGSVSIKWMPWQLKAYLETFTGCRSLRGSRPPIHIHREKWRAVLWHTPLSLFPSMCLGRFHKPIHGPDIKEIAGWRRKWENAKTNFSHHRLTRLWDEWQKCNVVDKVLNNTGSFAMNFTQKLSRL